MFSKQKSLRRMILAAMFLALALVLPFFTGQIPQIGNALCPMHIPVLLCGFFCGPWYALAVGGIALYKAAEKIRAKARTIAAHELEVAEEDLEWRDGKFQVAGAPDKAKTIPEIAFSAWTAHSLPADVEPGLFASAVYDPPNFTFPSGAHICVVEVDPDTGRASAIRRVAIDQAEAQRLLTDSSG